LKLLNPVNVLRQLIKFYDEPESLPLFDAATKVGGMGSAALPKDLIRIGMRMHLRGLLNTMAIQSNRDWVWPFWVERQFNPHLKGFLPRSHAIAHLNLTHRNWTILGALGNSHRAVIDPRGLITPWLSGWSLDCWLATPNKLHVPARLDEIKQKIHPLFPQIKTTFQAESFELKMRVAAISSKGQPLLLLRTQISNRASEACTAHFYYSIRPYNPEGISLIRTLEFADQHVWRVNEQLAILLLEAPNRAYCSNLRDGDVALTFREPRENRQVECDTGMATGLVEYTLDLKPRQTAHLTALLTLNASTRVASTSVLSSFNYPAVKHQFRKEWQTRLSQGAVLQFPRKKLNESFQANKMYLHVFDRGSTMTPGALTYSNCWIRDSAFMIHALDKLGFHDQAREKLVHLLTRQDKDGYFVSQEGEWDSNGQVLWAVLEHHKLTRNLTLLREVYPILARGAEWIERKRRETKRSASPHFGLLPAGISAEHLGPSDFYYWDNFWGVAGMRQVAQAAQLLGHESDATRLNRYANEYWTEIERSLQASEKAAGTTCLPASPYRRFDSGAIGSLCAVYPLGLIEAKHPRVLNTVRLIEGRFLVGDGFFQEHFHSGVNSYLTAHLAQCYLAMGNLRVWRLVRYLLRHASSTYTWPEAFHPITKGGCMGEGHHGWAAAEWILLLRNLLFYERGDNLCLTPLMNPKDLEPGNTLTVRSAPSYFGTVSFKVFADKKELLLEPGDEMEVVSANQVLWHLPFMPGKVTIDGKVLPKAPRVVPLPIGASRIVALR
jgi:hypothetical protein